MPDNLNGKIIKLKNLKEKKEDWTAIIDASISSGNKKLFFVLKTRSKINEWRRSRKNNK